MSEKEYPDRFPVSLPPGFRKEDHLPGLERAIKQKYPDVTYRIENIDLEARSAWAVRQRDVSEISHDKKTDSKIVNLVKGVKISEGDAYATKLEAQFPGYVLTDFEPHLLKARMTKLTTDERRARDKVAEVLRAKPWDVKIRSNSAGGFDLVLNPKYVKYTESAHLDKLQEQVESSIGEPGWFIRIDPKTMKGRILPGDPPTFEPVYHYNFSTLPKNGMAEGKELFRFPLGVALAHRGEKNYPVDLDFYDNVGLLLVGLAGSGKSVTTQAILFTALALGWRIALINTVDKATDFIWAKPYVADNMWGCDSVAQSVAVAKLVVEEGGRLGELLAEHGVSKWQDLPRDVRIANPPLLLVADELAALFSAPSLPPGLSKEMKELPEFVQMQQDLLESKLLSAALSQVPAVFRAAGIRAIYLTQQPNERYGFSTKLKGNLPHRAMLGTNPSSAEKGHAFRTPEKIPDVPRNIASDASLSRGVGLAHLDGKEPVVFKGYFAPLDTYISEAESRGFRKSMNPAPTERQIARLVPQIGGEEMDDGGYTGPNPSSKKQREPEAWELDPETGEPLTGRQRANAARHAATVNAKAASGG